MWIDALVVFIGTAMTLYFVLGGADYGAGILELFPAKAYRTRQKNIINHALGPVWEANHMWLVIVVVILFVGFPDIFNQVMISLHWPMVALLFGIVTRGAMFAFRHYDAVEGRRSQFLYTSLFSLSSLWTSLWIGIIGTSLFRGRLQLESQNVWLNYIYPWWGLLPLGVGFFVATMFTFLASIYLIGETHDAQMQAFFKRRARYLNAGLYVVGMLVFYLSQEENSVFLAHFFEHPVALSCFFIAFVFCALLWLFGVNSPMLLARILAAGQTTAILFGWYVLHLPAAFVRSDGPVYFANTGAPLPVLKQLLMALLIGSLLIFPSLFFLLAVFKQKKSRRPV